MSDSLIYSSAHTARNRPPKSETPVEDINQAERIRKLIADERKKLVTIDALTLDESILTLKEQVALNKKCADYLLSFDGMLATFIANNKQK